MFIWKLGADVPLTRTSSSLIRAQALEGSQNCEAVRCQRLPTEEIGASVPHDNKPLHVEASDDIFAQWDEDDTLLPTKLLPAIQQARGVYVPVRLLQYLEKSTSTGTSC